MSDSSDPIPPVFPDRSGVSERRRFWVLMGLLPSASVVLCFWIAASGGDRDGSIASLFVLAMPVWILLCAVKLARLRCSENAAGIVGLSLLYFVLFLMVDAVIGITLLWGSCMVSNYAPDRFH